MSGEECPPKLLGLHEASQQVLLGPKDHLRTLAGPMHTWEILEAPRTRTSWQNQTPESQ